ncbi:MAG: alanine dehydrogenase [bacterium]
MIIGIPREIKDNEYRVGMIPAGAADLTASGHTVLVEKEAGTGVEIPDRAFKEKGAETGVTAPEIYSRSDMIVKVKEPRLSEIELFQEELIIASFLHLAPEPEITAALLAKRVTGIAYETLREKDGTFPVLKPMSCIAGKASVQIGAGLLLRHHGGRGVLLGGVPGVSGGTVVIVGAGTVGSNALKIAVGMGAKVVILDIDTRKLERLEKIYGSRIETRYVDKLAGAVREADLLIGAVLVPGGLAPKVITRDMVKGMKPGSVIIDVAVDQGGCCETTRTTCHSSPTFVEEGVVHYGVSNIPGIVPVTSTHALAHASIKYIRKIADLGVPAVFLESEAVASGVNLYQGKVTCERVAQTLNLEYSSVTSIV